MTFYSGEAFRRFGHNRTEKSTSLSFSVSLSHLLSLSVYLSISAVEGGIWKRQRLIFIISKQNPELIHQMLNPPLQVRSIYLAQPLNSRLIAQPVSFRKKNYSLPSQTTNNQANNLLATPSPLQIFFTTGRHFAIVFINAVHFRFSNWFLNIFLTWDIFIWNIKCLMFNERNTFKLNAVSS